MAEAAGATLFCLKWPLGKVRRWVEEGVGSHLLLPWVTVRVCGQMGLL